MFNAKPACVPVVTVGLISTSPPALLESTVRKRDGRSSFLTERSSVYREPEEAEVLQVPKLVFAVVGLNTSKYCV